MITRTMARESPSLFSPPSRRSSATTGQAEEEAQAASSPTSPYSLSNEDMDQLTEEFDEQNLTTLGRTYEELVSASQEQEDEGQQQQEQEQHSQSPKKPSAIGMQSNSMMSEETDQDDLQPLKNLGGRKSAGFRMGRNSLSNWSAIGGGPTMNGIDENDIPSSVGFEQMHTGRKSNVSRHSLLSVDTPNIMSVSHVNVSQRRSNPVGRNSRANQRSTGNAHLASRRSSKGAESRRRDTSLNLSHISSSSSSGMECSGESLLGESWSPIRASLENSFAKSIVKNELNDDANRSSIGVKRSGSLSPIRGRESNSFSPRKFSPKKNTSFNSSSPKMGNGMSLSPIRGRTSNDIFPGKRSPTRQSSPKRSPGSAKSPVRSPVRSPLGDISPNRSPNRGRSPKKAASPKRNGATTSVTSPKRKDLSSNGTHSLKEAESSRLSVPKFAIAIDDKSVNSSNMSVSSGAGTATESKGKLKSPTRQSSPKRSPAKAKSPVRSPIHSPVRSPLGNISPNLSPNRGRSPKRGASPKRTVATTSVKSPKTKALSPNGTYSLKEADGPRLSLPEFAIAPDDESANISNMSVSSGAGTAESAAALAENAPQMKEAMPSLQESQMPEKLQKDLTPEAPKIASRKDDTEMMMLSPEKNTTKNHARSPAPTPNSQRRVVKRFRASIPTANYLMPEDFMEESVERNPNRMEVEIGESEGHNLDESVKDMCHSSCEESASARDESDQMAKPMAADKTATSMTVEEATEPEQDLYENAFEYPAELIPAPRTKTLQMFHDQAVSNESLSHQYQLNRAGTNLLSMQEVILPSIAYETNAVLKQKQSKAQRNAKDGLPDSQGKDVVEAIETCRKVVVKCTSKAVKVAGEAWRAREKERERLHLERLQHEEEQRKLDERKAKKERKEARARSRIERYERQKREKQRSHPRNKELWQEVAKLMMDIQKLEKEERLWKEALVEVNRLEEHHQPPEMIELDQIIENEEDVQLLKNVEGVDLESTATTLVEDVAMATERINWMLKSVSLAMDESDKLRKQAFDKYQYEGHKFYGYPQVDDSKGLFMALSMNTPLKE